MGREIRLEVSPSLPDMIRNKHRHVRLRDLTSIVTLRCVPEL